MDDAPQHAIEFSLLDAELVAECIGCDWRAQALQLAPLVEASDEHLEDVGQPPWVPRGTHGGA